MPCKQCGSYAINHNLHGRDGSDPDLCDVCYWRKRAESTSLDSALLDALNASGGEGLGLHKTEAGWWCKPKHKLTANHYPDLRAALIVAFDIEQPAA